MSADQLDMFGGSQSVAAEPPSGPYHPPAYGYKTCWEDCSHCGAWLSYQKHKDPKKRIFTLCLHPDKDKPKVFEHDAICQKAAPKPGRKAAAKQPPANAVAPPTGWEDY